MSDVISSDSLVGSGAATAPGSGATIASVTLPAFSENPAITNSERYRVRVRAGQSGTVDTAHLGALQLTHGTTVVATILSVGYESVLEIDQVSPGGDTDLTVKTTAAFGAGAIVAASIVATRIG